MQPPNNARVFVIGLDGATLPLVRRWTGEGKLPALAGLMTNGVFGHLQTVPNQNSAPAWTSFMTGKNPGKHGIYYFYEKEDNSYRIRYVNGGDRKCDAIWTMLSREDKKVIVTNVPMTYPARPVNGVLISGLDAPGIGSDRFTYPAAFAADLLKAVPDYVIEPGITTFAATKQYQRAVDSAMQSIEARGKAVHYLMKNYPWDFFMVVYRESDVIQHHFWKFMENKDGAGSGANAKYVNTIFDVYQRLDREVERILAELPEDCYVVVLSDHGFGAAEDGPPYFNHLLQHLGMLTFAELNTGGRSRAAAVRRAVLGKALSFVQRKTSRRTKERLLRFFPRIRDRMDSEKYFSNIDWSRTQVYGEGTRIELYVNLKGRDPAGVVSPGEEYDALCALLKKRLCQWHDPKTGKPVVKQVLTKEEVYEGPYAGKAPDLLVHFHDDVSISGIMLIDDHGEKEYVDVPPNLLDILIVNGAHRDCGIFCVTGPGVKKGNELQGARIYDLAPTILYVMGHGIPADMDGRPLLDAFEQDYVQRHPVKITGPSDDAPEGTDSSGYGDDEKAIIEDRLKGLGYL